MEVDFNELRQNLAEAFNALIEAINDNAIDGSIQMHDFEIRREVKDLAQSIKWILALETADAEALISKIELTKLKE